MAFASGAHRPGPLRMVRTFENDQDSDGGGLGARGGRPEAAWAQGMLCCHYLPLSADPQSWGRSGSRAHSALPGWKGRNLSPSPLHQPSLVGPGPTAWSSALSSSGLALGGPLLRVWRLCVVDCFARGGLSQGIVPDQLGPHPGSCLQGRTQSLGHHSSFPLLSSLPHGHHIHPPIRPFIHSSTCSIHLPTHPSIQHALIADSARPCTGLWR